MYVCDPCIRRHALTAKAWTCVAPCEICGYVDGDWAYKHTTWTPDVPRPVQEPEGSKAFIERHLAEIAQERAQPAPSTPDAEVA